MGRRKMMSWIFGCEEPSGREYQIQLTPIGHYNEGPKDMSPLEKVYMYAFPSGLNKKVRIGVS